MDILSLLVNIKLYIYNNININKEYYIILSYVLKKSYIWIISNLNYIFNNNELNILYYLLIQRLRGVPISYLTNKCYFLNFSYKIYYDVFIPRKDTEIMVEHCLYLIKINNFNNILELGIGCGAISISIAKFFPYINILGIDFNVICLELSKYNCKIKKIFNINFIYSNWFSKIENKKFNIIISNPPYINKYSNNIKEDLRFESYLSLYSKNNGLNEIKYIIFNSYRYLLNYGYLIIEHCFTQINLINYYLSIKGYFNIKNYKDYNNIFRFTEAQKII